MLVPAVHPLYFLLKKEDIFLRNSKIHPSTKKDTTRPHHNLFSLLHETSDEQNILDFVKIQLFFPKYLQRYEVQDQLYNGQLNLFLSLNYKKILKHARMIYDIRNVYQGVKNKKIVKF